MFLGRAYPIIYVLMKSKEESEYIRIFEKIKEITGIKPELIISDFEKSLNNAILKSFEFSKLQLCYFHLTQSIWRRIQFEKLANKYKNDKNFSIYIKKIMVSAFLPKEKIFDFFYKCVENYQDKNNEEIQKLNDFLAYTYFGRLDNGVYKRPIFDIKYWSIYERILKFEPRTTNIAEACHRVLNKNIGVINPNIALFIQKILEFEELNEVEIIQSKQGNITWSRKNYEKETRLYFLLHDFHYFSDEELVENILKVYDFNF
ncbi:hypothetical protein DMUE_5769 [Dictyocoela muelleri]|nr:hypothetical protein DMUE_5769 [Dictyocoela muelleri]